MSVGIGRIVEFMEEWAPIATAEEMDNVGLLVGCSGYSADRVLVALDAVKSVIDEAIEKKCQMIITHHPLFRSGQKKINDFDATGKTIIRLIENKIALLAAHTNLDKADGGVNDVLCGLLGLIDLEVKKEPNGRNSFMRIGRFKEPRTLRSLAEEYKETFKIPYLPVVGDFDRVVSTAAVVSGNGMSFLHEAADSGADVYISGDIRYHDANYAIDAGMALMDLTHYASETIIAPHIKRYLEKKRDENGLSFEVIVSEINAQPFGCV